MFGLMKNTGGIQTEQPDWYRLHYCGTCKSLGQIYGQRSRLFLNYDIVFLAEILTLLQEPKTQEWDPALFSKKCFDLPKLENLPLSLQYAADINTILVELKVRDNMSDDFSQVWKWAKRILDKPFSKVQERMEKWGIDDQVLLDFQLEDLTRESSSASNKSIGELLEFHAEPSAKITAYLFSKGAGAIGKTTSQNIISQIGFAFGELTYVLDAWKDLEKDQEEGSFNPLLFFPKQTIEALKKETENWIWKKSNSIKNLIDQIEIDAKIKASLQGRLQMNLAATLSQESHVCSPKSGIETSTVPTVIRTFWKTYRQATSWFNPLRPTRFVVGYMVFLFAFFQQKLFAAVDILKEPGNWNADQMLLVAGLSAVPVGLYYGGKKLKRNQARIRRRLKRKRKRLLRRLRRAEKKLKEGKKLKWWHWILIIFGAIFILLLILLIAALASSSSGNGGGCDGSGCGDACGASCGDSCGSSGGSGCSC